MPSSIQDKNKQLLEKLMTTETSEVTKTITAKTNTLAVLQLLVINLGFQAWAMVAGFMSKDLTDYLLTSVLIFLLTSLVSFLMMNRARMISKTISVLYEVAEREAKLKDFSKFTDEATNLKSTTKITKLLALALNIKEESAIEIADSVKYLDLGKVAIEDDLKKKTELTEEEFNKIKQHVEVGYKISKMMGQPQIIANVIRYHHERWDGTGYVHGLSKEDIPIEARIVAICDVYDALTHDRERREAHTHEQAIEIIKSESGKYFDPVIVQKFLELEPKVKELNGVN